MLSTYCLSVVLRIAIFYARDFSVLLLLVLSSEFLAAPAGVIADAVVVASCDKKSGYGRQRMWGSIGWGGLSFAGGLLLDKEGFGASFLAYALLSVPCLLVLSRFTYNSAAAHGPRSQADRDPDGNCPADGKVVNHDEAEDAPLLQVPFSSAGPTSPSQPAPCVMLVLDEDEGLPQLTLTPFAATELQRSRSGKQDASPSPDTGGNGGSKDGHLLMQGKQQRQRSIGESARSLAKLASSEITPRQVPCAAPSNRSSPSSAPRLTFDGGKARTQQPLQPAPSALETGTGPDSRGTSPPITTNAAMAKTSKDGIQARDAASQQRHVYQLHATASASLNLKAGGTHLHPATSLLRRRRSTASMVSVPLDPDGDGAAPKPATPGMDTTASAVVGAGGRQPEGFTRRALRLLSSGTVWLFLAKIFLLGFGAGTMGTWLLIYMATLGAPHALQGLMLTVNCVAEVPVFHFQSLLTAKFPTNGILHVSIGTLVLRLSAYALLPSLPGVPWVVLPVELLHGITFALCWGAACVHCKEIAPEGLQTTMQGLMQAVFNGIAGGLGGLVGAMLHHRLGGRRMFLVTAALIAAGWALLSAAEALAAVARRRRTLRGRYANDGDDSSCSTPLMPERYSPSHGRTAATGGAQRKAICDHAGRSGPDCPPTYDEAVAADASPLHGFCIRRHDSLGGDSVGRKDSVRLPLPLELQGQEAHGGSPYSDTAREVAGDQQRTASPSGLRPGYAESAELATQTPSPSRP